MISNLDVYRRQGQAKNSDFKLLMVPDTIVSLKLIPTFAFLLKFRNEQVNTMQCEETFHKWAYSCVVVF